MRFSVASFISQMIATAIMILILLYSGLFGGLGSSCCSWASAISPKGCLTDSWLRLEATLPEKKGDTALRAGTSFLSATRPLALLLLPARQKG
jgi:hypothetical protein